MAYIVGGVAVSHTPTIGFGHDSDKHSDPAWAPIFEGLKPVRQWFEQERPDAIVYIFNDHVTSFFFDHYSAFALGVGESFGVADEGGGPRALPPIAGHPELARHIGNSLMADEFDLSFFQDKPLDHGLFSPMSVLMPHDQTSWSIPLVPLQVGVLQFPMPSAFRCFKLGQALRRAIESYPADLAVAVVASGGLSHQVHGARAGFNNVEWDRRFLEMLINDPEPLTRMTQAEYATLGGMEGAEVIMWLIMRGALTANARCLHSFYYLPSMTGIATLLLENSPHPPEAAVVERHREHMAHQLDGIDKLVGTHPFTLQESVKSYRLSRFLHGLIEPEKRCEFRETPEVAFRKAGLTDYECRLIQERDWNGLIHYGVIFFLLEKLGAVLGVSNLDIYAAMRGQSLEEFLATRNTGVLYSVAGDDPSTK